MDGGLGPRCPRAQVQVLGFGLSNSEGLKSVPNSASILLLQQARYLGCSHDLSVLDGSSFNPPEVLRSCTMETEVQRA